MPWLLSIAVIFLLWMFGIFWQSTGWHDSCRHGAPSPVCDNPRFLAIASLRAHWLAVIIFRLKRSKRQNDCRSSWMLWSDFLRQPFLLFCVYAISTSSYFSFHAQRRSTSSLRRTSWPCFDVTASSFSLLCYLFLADQRRNEKRMCIYFDEGIYFFFERAPSESRCVCLFASSLSQRYLHCEREIFSSANNAFTTSFFY